MAGPVKAKDSNSDFIPIPIRDLKESPAIEFHFH